jgi:hypothetical protein
MGKANTFREVVELIRKAEIALIRNSNIIDPVQRAIALRGIFYGTLWSLDFKVEERRSRPGALIRNAGFLTYTTNSPPDPRRALGASLFNDLQASQSIHNGRLGIDIGHVLIGLETRASLATRTIPFPGQGGTGLEIVTWLGDLGGGAASLARKRITHPATSVSVIFNNVKSDYGVMDNLEGDVGGYLLAPGSIPGEAPVFPQGGGIAAAFANYLPITSTSQWFTRAERFTTALGGSVSSKRITNRQELINKLTDKLFDFAVWYAATRWIPTGELIGPQAGILCTHIKGSAREVATVLVTTLAKAIAAPGNPIKAVGPYPRPSVPGRCESILLKTAGLGGLL